MNNFFDEYDSSITSIKDFVFSSQKALEKQYIRECKDDFETIKPKRRFVLASPLEVHGAKIYTKEMFRHFQVELTKSHQFNINKIPECTTSESKSYTVYKVFAPEYVRRYFTVIYSMQTGSISCTRQKFKHAGVVCRHMLRFLTKKSFTEIPPNLIVYRWTRDYDKLYGQTPNVVRAEVDYLQSQTTRYNHLCKRFFSLAAKASCTTRGYNHVLDLVKKAEAHLMTLPPEGNSDSLLDEEQQ